MSSIWVSLQKLWIKVFKAGVMGKALVAAEVGGGKEGEAGQEGQEIIATFQVEESMRLN